MSNLKILYLCGCKGLSLDYHNLRPAPPLTFTSFTLKKSVTTSDKLCAMLEASSPNVKNLKLHYGTSSDRRS